MMFFEHLESLKVEPFPSQTREVGTLTDPVVVISLGQRAGLSAAMKELEAIVGRWEPHPAVAFGGD